jgi:hypothetical protein
MDRCKCNVFILTIIHVKVHFHAVLYFQMLACCLVQWNLIFTPRNIFCCSIYYSTKLLLNYSLPPRPPPRAPPDGRNFGIPPGNSPPNPPEGAPPPDEPPPPPPFGLSKTKQKIKFREVTEQLSILIRHCITKNAEIDNMINFIFYVLTVLQSSVNQVPTLILHECYR